MMTKNDVRAMYASKFDECPAQVERMLDAFMVDAQGGIYSGAAALLTGETVYLTREEIISSINGGLEAEVRYIRKLQTAWDAPKADADGISLDSI